MPGIYELFATLAYPGEGYDYSAAPLAPGPHRIARTKRGLPAILIKVSGGEREARPLRLRYLDVRHRVTCQVYSGGLITSDSITVIECTGDDPAVGSTFLRVAEHVSEVLGIQPSVTDVQAVVGQLVDLFAALTEQRGAVLQGLWGELLLLHCGRQAESLAAAWRRTDMEWFDFALDDQRIEVKSTASKDRRHRFAIEQVATPGVRILVASIVVKEIATGLTVYDLLDRICNRITDADTRLRLETTAGVTIGSQASQAREVRFDYNVARQSRRFVHASDIPQPTLPPPGVSDLSFTSDVSACVPASLESLISAGGLWGAVAG